MPLDRIGVLPRRRRDPDGGRPRARPFLHQPPARGARLTNETMLLGADTIRPVLNRLLPDIDVIARPRFSNLSLCRPEEGDTPARVARPWSASRPTRSTPLRADPPPAAGGTAIVMGALSPANAQRPGRHVPGRRGRPPGRHRRDRHGPQHGRQPRLVRVVAKYDGRDAQAVAQRRDGPDRRARRPAHE